MNEGTRTEAPAEPSRGPFPWQRGWSIFKAIWPQLIYISMAAIAIPQYLAYWLNAQRAAKAVHDINTVPFNGFFPLLDRVELFSSFNALNFIITAFFAVWGYLALVTAAFAHIDGHKVEFVPTLLKSLRHFIPRGFLTFLLFLLPLFLIAVLVMVSPGLGIVLQLFLITLCVVAAAAPVLLVMDYRSARRIFGAALKMEYTKGSGMSRWSAYFVLLTYEMLLLGSLSLVQAGAHALNHLDTRMNLPRTVWFVTSDAFPFGVVPMLTEGLAIALSALLFAMFAIMTTSFVADLKRIGRIRSTIEIRI